MLNFQDTRKAFSHKSLQELKAGVWLFRTFNYKFIVKYGPIIAKKALQIGLPIKSLIKNTLFKWFCGGEDISECKTAIGILAANNVGTILDYSVEGEENENAYEQTKNEIIKTIAFAKLNKSIPFTVFKASGIVNSALLEKVSAEQSLTSKEQGEYSAFEKKFEEICKTAFENKIRIFVDAEESWIQEAIDNMAYRMMEKYNTANIYIYNTIQLYRHDRLAHLTNQISEKNFLQGYKLVRGAYLEKEIKRAAEKGYQNPINASKQATDDAFNKAMQICISNINRVAFCAGTHNEESSLLLTTMMDNAGIAKNHQHIWFAQLYGMSDNISFNLANQGYNVGKYLPYGPIISVLPYLSRRAQENSSIAGQASRELTFLKTEIKRRKKAKFAVS